MTYSPRCLAVFCALVSFSVTSTVPAARASDGKCALVICDPTSELAEYRKLIPLADLAMRQKRQEILRDYLEAAQQTRDLQSLRNLIEFGLGARDFLAGLGEEEWIINSSIQLIRVSRVRVVEFSPVVAAELDAAFDALDGPTDREQAIGFWSGQVTELEDVASLLELAKFFSHSALVSENEDDDDYIIQMAIHAEEAVHARIADISPYYEGTYAIQGHCPDETACDIHFTDRLVILNTFAQDGIRVAFASSTSSITAYDFTNVKVTSGGSHLEALTRNSATGELARLDITIDPDALTLFGTIRTIERTLSFGGKPIPGGSVGGFFKNGESSQPPLTTAVFDAPLSGTFDGEPIHLLVTVFSAKQIGAQISFDRIPGLKLTFSSGRIFLKSRVLLLAGEQQGEQAIKVALKFEPVGISWNARGIAFSTLNGRLHGLMIGDGDDPN